MSDEQKAGTFSLEIPKSGEKFDESKIKKLNVESSLYGMLYAFDHLYLMGNRKLTHLLFCLKDIRSGWSMNDRKAYLGELQNLATKKGGNMFTGYIQKIREWAIASVPEKDRISLQYLMGEVISVNLAKLPRAEGPGIASTVDSALKILQQEPWQGRSFKRPKKRFSAGLWVACHRYGNEGDGVGPDLTNLAKRSEYKSMLESTIHPNMVVSEQFEQHELKMKDGSLEMGRVVTEENEEYSLVQSGLETLMLIKIPKSEVA